MARTATLVWLLVVAPVYAETRGMQITPDGKRVLVNKDVGDERWSITRNDDGTVTGNVFRRGGGEPAFVYCRPLAMPDAYECFGADACRSTTCDGDYASIGTVTLPPGFFARPLPIRMTVDARVPVQAFLLRVRYPTSKGSFQGSGEDVACTTEARGIFTRNDDDQGSLMLSVADATELAFPIDITCLFGAEQGIAMEDLDVVVQEVVSNNGSADPSFVTVDVAVEP